MMLLRLCVFFIFIYTFSFSQSIRINEVAASNSIFLDEDGDTPDWIELYNYGADEISLNNWSLTDILDDNNPWTFPDITIDAHPKEYTAMTFDLDESVGLILDKIEELGIKENTYIIYSSR